MSPLLHCFEANKQGWEVAANVRAGFNLVTFGSTDFISSVCLGGGDNLFFEEPVSVYLQRLFDSNSIIERGYQSKWFLDVGSNLGVHSFSLAARGVPVIAIEANPSTAKRVQCSAALNNFHHVSVINAAISDKDARVCIRLWEGNMGGNSVESKCDSNSIFVPTLSLNTLFRKIPSQFGPPFVMKMDVEGFELAALRGGLDWMKEKRNRPPIIFTELVPDYLSRSGGTWTDLLAIWFDLGYMIWSPQNGGSNHFKIERQDVIDRKELILQRLKACEYNLVLSQISLPIPIPTNFCVYKGNISSFK
jgi:hypothetical protein